jgi:hypothetical protein
MFRNQIDLRHNGEFYLPCLYVKDPIGRVALSKYRLLLGKSFDLSAAALQGSLFGSAPLPLPESQRVLRTWLSRFNP